MFAKKRELASRQAILRGVYEENLRIIGKYKGGITITRTRPFFLNKLFLTCLMSMIVILTQVNNLTPSLVSDDEQIPAPVMQPSPQGPADNSFNSADYKAFSANAKIPLSRVFGLGVRTIMIDPGHGGTASGTIGKMGTREKDIALDIAKRLKTRLEHYGRFNILMTREQDITLPLNRRVEMATANRADLFISIHLNYLPTRPINVIETYYFGPSSDSKTLSIAERENAGSQYGLSDFREMLEKMGKTMKVQESRELASSIQNSLYVNIKKEHSSSYNFGVKRAPFVVLLGVDIPAVLAEVSCLSNQEAETELNTERHRENIAHYLETGILDYLNKGEATHDPKEAVRKPDRYAGR